MPRRFSRTPSLGVLSLCLHSSVSVSYVHFSLICNNYDYTITQKKRSSTAFFSTTGARGFHCPDHGGQSGFLQVPLQTLLCRRKDFIQRLPHAIPDGPRS